MKEEVRDVTMTSTDKWYIFKIIFLQHQKKKILVQICRVSRSNQDPYERSQKIFFFLACVFVTVLVFFAHGVLFPFSPLFFLLHFSLPFGRVEVRTPLLQTDSG